MKLKKELETALRKAIADQVKQVPGSKEAEAAARVVTAYTEALASLTKSEREDRTSVENLNRELTSLAEIKRHNEAQENLEKSKTELQTLADRDQRRRESARNWGEILRGILLGLLSFGTTSAIIRAGKEGTYLDTKALNSSPKIKLW